MSPITRKTFLTGAAAASLAAAGFPAAAFAEEAPAAEVATETVKPGMQSCPMNESPNFYMPFEGTVAFEADPVADELISSTADYDLVVCGSGFSGLCTAVSGANAGLSVVVLEKTAVFNSRGADLAVINGKFVEDAGGEFDQKVFYETALKASQYRCSQLVWQKWIANCGVAVDWMVDLLGDAIEPSLNLAEDGSGTVTNNGVTVYRDQLNVKGGIYALSEALYNKAVELGVTFEFETPAVQLVQDESGAVTGVVAKNADGYLKFNAAAGVALCTGGYENNWDMLRACIPQGDLVNGSWRLSCHENTGDGHMMGLALGAAIDGYPHAIMRAPGGPMKSHRIDCAGALYQPWVRVNESGDRFVNESLSVNYRVNAISQQANSHCWCLIAAPNGIEEAISSTSYRNGTQSISKKEPSELVDLLSDDFQVYDTIQELAEGCGIDPEGLAATIARLQEIHEAGEDTDWGNDITFIFDWTSGPYYAIEEGGAALVTVNGLKTSPKSEVLDCAGTPIPGLYAIGNVSGNMFYGTYPHELSGISHGRALTFGYLLGQRLAGKIED